VASSPSFKRPDCEAGHSPPLSVKVKTRWSYASTSPWLFFLTYRTSQMWNCLAVPFLPQRITRTEQISLQRSLHCQIISSFCLSLWRISYLSKKARFSPSFFYPFPCSFTCVTWQSFRFQTDIQTGRQTASNSFHFKLPPLPTAGRDILGAPP